MFLLEYLITYCYFIVYLCAVQPTNPDQLRVFEEWTAYMNKDPIRRRELADIRQAKLDETTRKRKVWGGAQRVLELENGQQGMYNW